MKKPKMLNKEFFRDWDYKKHFKLCTAIYLSLYTFDLTVSYLIVKKLLKKYDVDA